MRRAPRARMEQGRAQRRPLKGDVAEQVIVRARALGALHREQRLDMLETPSKIPEFGSVMALSEKLPRG